MGKLLVIKGADFSENAIENVLNVDIAPFITVSKYYNRGVYSQGDPNRMGTVESIDLSEYIAQGLSIIKITPKTGYNWVGMLSNNASVTGQSGDDSNSKLVYDGTPGAAESWRADSGTGTTINSTFKYLHLGVRKSDNTSFEQVESLASAFVKIELFF